MGKNFQVAANDDLEEKLDRIRKEYGVKMDSDLLKILIDIRPSLPMITGLLKLNGIPEGVKRWASTCKFIITGEMEEFEG